MSTSRQVGNSQVALGLGVAAAALGVAALLRQPGRPAPARRLRLPGPSASARQPRLPAALGLSSPPAGTPVTIAAGHRLNRAAGMLALSVLADSAIEHYRGSFKNRLMYTPLAVSALSLLVSMHGLADTREATHRARHASYLAAALTGLIGTGSHVYNVLVRPGGLSWQNLFYGAPLGAPAAILLSGLLGAVAERVRGTPRGKKPEILGVPAGRAIAGVSAAGLLGTTAEAALLHFRGAFHDPFMALPVTLPPVGALLLARLAFYGRATRSAFTRWWLRLTSAMGLIGAGFHAYGVGRNMGGWRNWKQNVLNGPPLPAPPSFTGLALAGLAAIALIEGRRDA